MTHFWAPQALKFGFHSPFDLEFDIFTPKKFGHAFYIVILHLCVLYPYGDFWIWGLPSNYTYMYSAWLYRVWHPATILLSRSCHWMDHLECSLTWKLVYLSVLYLPFKASWIFLPKTFVWKSLFFRWSNAKKYCLLQFGKFQSRKKVA